MTGRPLRTRAAVACSIADQGVAALTNIAVLVVAARQSSAAGFAVFSVVYTVFTVLLGLSVGYVGQALVLERGPVREVRAACRAAVVFTAAASGAVALSAGGVLWLATGFEGRLAAGLGALLLVLPVVLTHDCLRYAFATLHSPHRALAADVLRLATGVAALAAQPRGAGADRLIAVWGASAIPALLLGLTLLWRLSARGARHRAQPTGRALGPIRHRIKPVRRLRTALGHRGEIADDGGSAAPSQPVRRLRTAASHRRVAADHWWSRGRAHGSATAGNPAEGRPQTPDGLDSVRSASSSSSEREKSVTDGLDAVPVAERARAEVVAGGAKRYVRRGHLGARFALEFAVGNAGTQLAVIALGLWANPLAVGALRGATTLFGPMNVLFNAATGFGPPLLNRTGGPRRSARAALAAGGVLAAGAAVWAVVLVLLPDRYGRMLLGDTWAAASGLLSATGSQYAAMALGTCGLLALRVLRPRTTLPIQLVFSLFTVCCMLTGYALGGVLGAAWGLCAGSVCKAAASWLRVRRVLRTPYDAGDAADPERPTQPEAPVGAERPAT